LRLLFLLFLFLLLLLLVGRWLGADVGVVVVVVVVVVATTEGYFRGQISGGRSSESPVKLKLWLTGEGINSLFDGKCYNV
jgi:hypothetical protein